MRVKGPRYPVCNRFASRPLEQKICRDYAIQGELHVSRAQYESNLFGVFAENGRAAAVDKKL